METETTSQPKPKTEPTVQYSNVGADEVQLQIDLSQQQDALPSYYQYLYNAEQQTVTRSPVYVISSMRSTHEPKDYFLLSIITTFCCSPPFGILALMYALKTRNYRQSGDITRAVKSSKKAKLFILIGILSNIIFILILVVVLQSLAYNTDKVDCTDPSTTNCKIK